MIKLLTLAAAALFTMTAQAEITLDPARTVYILGRITEESVAAPVKKMKELTEKPATLYVDSFGGQVNAGMKVMDKVMELQERGVTVNCVIPRHAFSAAFYIIMKCDQIYAFGSARLMFHPSRLLLDSSPPVEILQLLLNQGFKHNLFLAQYLLSTLPMDKGLILQSFYGEWIWEARFLKQNLTRPGYIKIIKKIKGVDMKTLVPYMTRELARARERGVKR